MTATLAARDAKQVETVGISLLDICRHDCFAEGYISIARGLPFDSFYGGTSREDWFYERGRLVAVEARERLGRVPALWCDTDLGSVINPRVIDIAGAMLVARHMT